MPYRLAIAHYAQSFRSMRGWIQGLEPWASRATIWRASQLRYIHHIKTPAVNQAVLGEGQ